MIPPPAIAQVRRAVLITLIGGSAAAATTPLAEETRQALVDVGTVDRLAATALRTPAADPATLRAQAELAVEAGDLDVALPLWRAVCAGTPPVDATALGTWAALAELAGRDDEAERAWRACIGRATSPSQADGGRLRLAMLLLDGGRPGEARPLLDAAATSNPAGTGLVAALYGQDDAAVSALAAATAAPVGLQLALGDAALRAGRLASARQAFESVAGLAPDRRDRQFAAEQAIAVAAREGSIGDLTRRWSADSGLPPERCVALAVALRESGRDADLLDWWRHGVDDPARRDALWGERVVAEVAAAARATGRPEDVSAVCHELLNGAWRNPQTVALAARLRLDAGDLASADAVLDGEAAAAASDGPRLLRTGKLARSLDRAAAARRIAGRLVHLGGADAVRGLLLDASVSLRVDDRAGAIAILRRAAAAARNAPELADDVAAALDGAGQTDDAIDLIRGMAGTDDGRLFQLAGVLLQARRPAEAMSVLDQLRRTTRSPGAAAQAGQRMLEIAGVTNGYDALAARLKRSLADGRGTARDVLLLADVDQAAHRPELAVSLLRSTPLLDEPGRLQRLATLFLRTKEYGRADDVLRRLVAVRPADAVATLEQIAWVAIQRNDTADANAAIGEVAARSGDGPAGQERVGGLYDRLGFPAEAAGHYRRAIAAGGAADDWLLWSAAMTKSGRPDVAGQRLQMLCVDGRIPDATFVVAVDGLLGLDTPPAAVRAVRRATVVRAATAPAGATPLLHIVGDLSDELADATFRQRALALVAALSPDERPQVLRSLCEAAAAGGDADGAVALGTALLATGDTFPPQVFLDVGERLLVVGRDAAAARAFARAAGLSASDDGAAQRVAAVFEKYGRFADAERVLAPVAARHPRDPALAATVARQLEILGRPHEAFSLYLQAADLTLSRGGSGGEVARLAAALVATARTADDRTAAVRLLSDHLDRVVRPPDGPDPLPAVRDAVRRLSQAHTAELATAATTRPTVFTPGPADLPFLIATGDTGRARDVVRSAPADSAAEVCRTAPLRIAAAAALGEQSDVTQWSLRWLVATPPPRSADVARAVWDVLPAAGRRSLVDALLALPSYGTTSADSPALAAVRLAAADGVDVGDHAALAARLLDNPATAEAVAVELFADWPAGDRPALVRLALGRVPPAHRLSLLATLVDRTTEPLDTATAAVMVDAAMAVPPGQVVIRSDWFTNGSQRAVVPALADAALGAGGPEAADASLAAGCAVAFSVAGDADRADRAALAAISRTMSSAAGEDGSADLDTLRTAATALSDGARWALLRRLTTAVTPEQPARQLTYIAAVLRACGRPGEALDVDRQNHTWHPTDGGAAAALAVTLAGEGRPAELVDALGPRSGHAWGVPVRRLVAAALVSLGRSAEARQLDPRDVSAFAGLSGGAGASQAVRSALEAARVTGAAFVAPADVGQDVADDLYANLHALPAGAGRLTTDVARATAAATVRDGEATGRVLGDLAARATAGGFSNVDATLVRELLAADPGLRLPPPLLNTLRSRVRSTGSDESVGVFAAAIRSTAPVDVAGPDAWTRVRRRMGGQDGDGLPGPLEAVDDQSVAHGLIGLIDDGKASDAERAVARLRREGRAGGHQPSIGLAWARLAAERNDLAAFRQRLAEVLGVSEWKPEAFPAEDVRLALPTHAGRGNGAAVATAAAATVEANPRCPGGTQMLTVIGVWAVEDGERTVAADLLDRADRLGEADAEPSQRVAVADLARRLGNDRRADAIELALLRARCLPVDRVGRLLDNLRRSDAAHSNELSAEALRYCRWRR